MLKAIFEVTEYCNYNCCYCFSSVCENKTFILGFEKFKTIIDNIRKLNENFVVSFEGGEPLSDINNIFGYIDYVKNIANEIYLKTNASLIPILSDEQIFRIKNSFDNVDINLCTVNPVLFEEISKFKIFDVLQGIEICKNLNIPIVVNCVITNLNKSKENILSLVRFCENSHIEKLNFSLYIPRDGLNPMLIVDDFEYEEIKKFLNNLTTNVSIKLKRYNKEYSKYLVISAKGTVKTFRDSEMKEEIFLGYENEFLNNYKKLIKNKF